MYITMQITPRVVMTEHFLFIDIQFKTWVKYIFGDIRRYKSCHWGSILSNATNMCHSGTNMHPFKGKKAHCCSNFYGVQNVYHVNLAYHVLRKIPLSQLHCDYSTKRDRSHVTVIVTFMLMQSSRNKSSKTWAHIDICYLSWICMCTHSLGCYIELHKNAWEGHMLTHTHTCLWLLCDQRARHFL